ncbi:MAG: hypothetical protein A2583_04330 [Bdellovibrionales bacterium RIFOXYD1_FULL_53_11]|nr:MAG: hypothetical protein A2583_04330 [Bdellovibrionales bacterium RIFOXYD1_FULL_53_11]
MQCVKIIECMAVIKLFPQMCVLKLILMFQTAKKQLNDFYWLFVIEPTDFVYSLIKIINFDIRLFK